MSDPQSAVSDPRPSMLATPFPKPSLPKHLQEEETVTMVFPRKLSLTLDDSDQTVHFEAGIQEVPVSLAEQSRTKDRTGKWSEPGLHWYLKQQGVRRYEKPKPQKVDPEVLAEQLRDAGYEVAAPFAAKEQLDEEEEVIDSAPAPDAGKVAAPRGMRARKRG